MVAPTNNISTNTEEATNSFFGKYRGIVVDNNDPENLGRLKINVPSLFGNDLVTGWAMPCVPYGGTANCGFVAIPDIDAGVWIEFEEGELEFPIWVGTYWSKPGGTTEIPQPANEHRPPTSKIFKTNKHSVELADEDGKEVIKIIENERNEITIDDKGIEIKDTNENKIRMESGKIVLEGKQIYIGSAQATEPLVLGTKLLIWLSAHTHPTAMGPSGPPTPPPLPTSFASQQHFIDK